jgi:hypothetical protein
MVRKRSVNSGWRSKGGAPAPHPYAPFLKGPFFRTFRHPSCLPMSTCVCSNEVVKHFPSFEYIYSKYGVDLRVLSVICCAMVARQKVLPAHCESEEFPPTRSAVGIFIPRRAGSLRPHPRAAWPSLRPSAKRPKSGHPYEHLRTTPSQRGEMSASTSPDLTIFRMNTYEKRGGGWGVPSLNLYFNSLPRQCEHRSPILADSNSAEHRGAKTSQDGSAPTPEIEFDLAAFRC